MYPSFYNNHNQAYHPRAATQNPSSLPHQPWYQLPHHQQGQYYYSPYPYQHHPQPIHQAYPVPTAQISQPAPYQPFTWGPQFQSIQDYNHAVAQGSTLRHHLAQQGPSQIQGGTLRHHLSLQGYSLQQPQQQGLRHPSRSSARSKTPNNLLENPWEDTSTARSPQRQTTRSVSPLPHLNRVDRRSPSVENPWEDNHRAERARSPVPSTFPSEFQLPPHRDKNLHQAQEELAPARQRFNRTERPRSQSPFERSAFTGHHPSRSPSATNIHSSVTPLAKDRPQALNSNNLARHTSNMATTSFADYDETVSDVSRLTVDRLKNVLRHMNHRLGHGHRMSGLKAELAGRVRTALDSARRDQDSVAYSEIRRAVKSPYNISVGSQASDTTTGTAAAATNPPAPVLATAPPPVSAVIPQPVQPTFSRAAPQPAHSAPAWQRPPPPPTYSQQNAVVPGFGFSVPSTSNGGFRYGVPPPTGPAALSAPTASTSASASASTSKSPLIAFRTNPFFEVSQCVSTVSVCPKAPSGDRKSTVGIINLSEDQRQLLLDSRNDPTKPQYQLRLYCTSETYFSLPVSSYPYARQSTQIGNQPFGPAPVEFPQTSEVKLNNMALNANLRGIKKKEGSTVPPDLNRGMNGLKALDLRPHGTNRVELVYINSDKKYFFVVNLVRYRDAAYQVNQLKKGKVKAKEEVAREVVAQNSDPDIVATSSVLSLKCPLTFIRMSNPTRSIKCSHMQCFDAESFYSMMEQTPVFNCPVCNKLLKVEDLVIDGYTQDVLKTVPSSYESVVVEVDGTWRTEDNKCGTNAKVGSAPSRAASADVKPNVNRPSMSRSGSNAGQTNGGGGSVQILDDSDDDAPSSSRAARDSAISSKSSSTTNGHGGGKSGGAVIDLTLSDDEDEEPARTSGSGVAQLAGQKRGNDFLLPPTNRPRYDY